MAEVLVLPAKGRQSEGSTCGYARFLLASVESRVMGSMGQ